MVIDEWRTMYGWGHTYDIVSGVDHLGFKSVRIINDDGMRASMGHRCRTTDPSPWNFIF
jgi:hypothetical protein